MTGGGMLPAASSTTGAEYKHYEGRITVYVLLTCLLAACGGLMFGYDIGISGMYNKTTVSHAAAKISNWLLKL